CTTASELFLALITAWAAQLPPREGRVDWALAVQHAAAELTALTAELFGRPPESLNCLLSTPGTLVAFAQHDPAQAPTDQPIEVYDLRWRAEADRALVSSTGYPQPGFAALARGAARPVPRGSLRGGVHAPLPRPRAFGPAVHLFQPGAMTALRRRTLLAAVLAGGAAAACTDEGAGDGGAEGASDGGGDSGAGAADPSTVV